MTYLISNLWGWMVVAAVLGFIVGWLTCRPSDDGHAANWFGGWLPWAFAAAFIGLVAAMLAWLPGRGGFWLETALLLFASYIVGCCLGGWVRQMVMDSRVGALALAGSGTAVGVMTGGDLAVPPPARSFAAERGVSAPLAAAPAPVQAAPKLPDEDKHEGRRPFGLVAPRGGKADDLKRIRGIGQQNEGRLHGLGVWHFDQIAGWTHDNVLWVGSYLAFPGRIDREKWIEQSKVLATGAETDFSKRVDAGEVTTSKDAGDHGQGNVAKVERKE